MSPPTFNLSIVDIVVKFTICIRKRLMDTTEATFVVRSEIDREIFMWTVFGQGLTNFKKL